ncbi:MAG: hypothetical protein ACRD5B_16855, partial [Nitrososphaeraceae archaeon]
MVLSVVIALIPHLNQQQYAVGEDTTVYSDWMQDLKQSKDLGNLLRLTFVDIQFGDRPLSLMILFALLNMLNSNVLFVFEMLLPALLSPLLVLSIYFLTKEITRNTLAALFSAFITAVSFQTMIGVYAGFYANWIALVFGYFSLLFVLRFLNTHSNKYLIAFSITLIALLFSHVYTWTIFTTFMIILLIVLKWKRLYKFEQIKLLFIIIAVVVAIDLSKSSLIGSASAIQRDLAVAESFDFFVLQLSERWSVLVRTVEVFLGGIFGNILILSLALYCGLTY